MSRKLFITNNPTPAGEAINITCITVLPDGRSLWIQENGEILEVRRLASHVPVSGEHAKMFIVREEQEN